jgi:hypothetical protein
MNTEAYLQFICRYKVLTRIYAMHTGHSLLIICVSFTFHLFIIGFFSSAEPWTKEL